MLAVRTTENETRKVIPNVHHGSLAHCEIHVGHREVVHHDEKKALASGKSAICRVVTTALALFVFISGVGLTRAQDRPTAFGSDTDLSAANKSEYLRVAGLYKTQTQNKTAANAAMRKDLRNQLISLTIGQTDLNFLSYQKKTRHRRAIFETLLDILEIGTSTAITLTKGERARTIISEALGFEQLSRQSINKNFSLKETQILFNKMVAKRADTQANILTKMNAQEDDQYSFATAMIDLISYYRAGTIDGALENLNIDTGAEAQKALEVLENVKLSPPATKEEAALAKAANDTLFDLGTDLGSQDAATKTRATNKLLAMVTELEKDKSIIPFLKAADISSQDTNGDELRLGLLNVRRALRSLDPPNFDLLNKINKVIVDIGR